MYHHLLLFCFIYILFSHSQLMEESGLHFSCVFLIVWSGLFVLRRKMMFWKAVSVSSIFAFFFFYLKSCVAWLNIYPSFLLLAPFYHFSVFESVIHLPLLWAYRCLCSSLLFFFSFFFFWDTAVRKVRKGVMHQILTFLFDLNKVTVRMDDYEKFLSCWPLWNERKAILLTWTVFAEWLGLVFL